MALRIFRIPNAVASLKDGEVTYFVRQKGSSLLETQYGDDLVGGEEIDVGLGKPGTSGVYVLLGEKRAFYCLNEQNLLQNFIFDDEYGTWGEGSLVNQEAAAARDSAVAAARTDDGGVRVFFVDSSRALRSYQLSGDSDEEENWEAIDDLPPVQLSEIPSIYALRVGGKLRVFYTHEDHYVHELVYSTEWTDNRVALTESSGPKKSVVATPSEDGLHYALQFLNKDQELFHVYNGKVTLKGRYESGEFHKSNKSENFDDAGPQIAVISEK